MKTVKRDFDLQVSNTDSVYGTVYDVTPCVGVVMIVHDVFEHRFIYEPLIESLNNQQLTVVTYDLRGHHLSLVNGVVGHFDAEGLVSDLQSLIHRLHQTYPNLNVTLFGGKVSGWIINRVLPLVEVNKVVLVDVMRVPRFLKLTRTFLRLLPKKGKGKLGRKLLLEEKKEMSNDPFMNRELTNLSYVAICDLLLTQPQVIHYPLSILLLGSRQDHENLLQLKEYYQKCGIYDCQLVMGEKISLNSLLDYIL